MEKDDLTEKHGPIEIPIDGVIDLHTFNPREVKDLLPHYLSECRVRGILQIRVIHGKGSGVLRRTVHAILGRLSGIASFRLAQEDAGGWGATIVTLDPEASPLKETRREGKSLA